MTTIFQRKIRTSTADRGSSTDNTIVDLTGIGVGSSSSSSSNIDYNKKDSSPYLCNFCDVPLIKKMDDIELLGTKDAGTAVNTRFICPRCGNIKDPLKVADFDKLKRVERGQTIRSSSSPTSEDKPFAEMFNSNSNTNIDNKGSLEGTQVSKALLRNINDPEPNEDSMLRGQNMRILKTETRLPNII